MTVELEFWKTLDQLVQSRFDFLLERRSVRRFQDRRLPAGMIERLLGAAIRAPSAHNRQPWRFVVLESPPARQRLVDCMAADFQRDLQADGLSPAEIEAQISRSRNRILEAPAGVLVCLASEEIDQYPDPPRQAAAFLMAVQGVSMAAENLLLAAHVEGLGGVWLCAPLFAQDSVRRCLDLPDGWQAQGLILLGYPARIPPKRERQDLTEVTCYR